MTTIQRSLFDLTTVQVTITETDEWYTPPHIIDAARATLGSIDLDPASSPAANRIVQARQFYTAYQDGLTCEWRRKLWLNPPYSDPLPWMRKLSVEFNVGRVEAYIALVPERVGVTWFNIIRDMSDALCFVDERIRFARADGRKPSSPNFGNILFYGGAHVDRFYRTFDPAIGKVAPLSSRGVQQLALLPQAVTE